MADQESRQDAVPYQVRWHLDSGRWVREALVGADAVGLRLPNGMEVELRWREEEPRRLQVYTSGGGLVVEASRSSSNVVGLLCLRERERLAVVDARTGEVVR